MMLSNICVLVSPSIHKGTLVEDKDISCFEKFILIDTDMTFLDELSLFLESKGKEVTILNRLDQLSKTLVSWNIVSDYQLEVRYY